MTTKRGPKPKPTQQKKLEGNPGRRPLPKDEPTAPIPPQGTADRLGLTGRSREWYDNLANSGIITELDIAAFMFMVAHYNVGFVAAQEINAYIADCKKTGKVIRKHALSQVLRDNSAAFLKYAVQFGMTPSARVGLSVGKVEKEKSLADQLFEAASKE
jgi:P27 family predicted phage terminase small subunit